MASQFKTVGLSNQQSGELKSFLNKKEKEVKSRKVKVKGYRRADGTIVKATVRETPLVAVSTLRGDRREGYIDTGEQIGLTLGSILGGTIGFQVGSSTKIPFNKKTDLTLAGTAVGGVGGAYYGMKIGGAAGGLVFDARSKINSFRPAVKRKLAFVDQELKGVNERISSNDAPDYSVYMEKEALLAKKKYIKNDFKKMEANTLNFNKEENSTRKVKVRGYKKKDGTIVKATVREYDPSENVLKHANKGALIGFNMGALLGGIGGGTLGSAAGLPGTFVGSAAGAGLGAVYGANAGYAAGIGIYNTRSRINRLRPSVVKQTAPLTIQINQLDKTMSKSKKPNAQLIAARENLNNKRLRIYDTFSRDSSGLVTFARPVGAKDKKQRAKRLSGLKKNLQIKATKLRMQAKALKGRAQLQLGKVNRSIQDKRDQISNNLMADGQKKIREASLSSKIGQPGNWSQAQGIIESSLGQAISRKVPKNVVGKTSRESKKKPTTNYGFLPGEATGLLKVYKV